MTRQTQSLDIVPAFDAAYTLCNSFLILKLHEVIFDYWVQKDSNKPLAYYILVAYWQAICYLHIQQKQSYMSV